MKKLLIAMGFFATIVLTSSCTPDSPLDSQQENLVTPSKTSDPGTAIYADTDGISEPTPPKK
jgi:hypothetical protein